MTYYFEMVQKLRFVVYDIDNDTPSLDDDDYLGNIECTLGEVNTRERGLVYVHVDRKMCAH